ncbi:hypothetical protein SB775_07060 [Peribacillus sp. SIMBA_075]|uniref:hypothetical protein n=1 Tax=Peribacillus sp. SIMBA_075 TaxID=3085813 RepID=UPI00070D846A|nr:hypothetical protein ASG99_13680 [Bacillus sp. Soil768D1]
MIIKTITVSEWSTETFDRDLEKGIKKLQSENLVVEVQFSTVYRIEREGVEYNALLIGRRK